MLSKILRDSPVSGGGESRSTLGDCMGYRCSGLMKRNVAAKGTSVMIRPRLCSVPLQLRSHLCQRGAISREELRTCRMPGNPQAFHTLAAHQDLGLYK